MAGSIVSDHGSNSSGGFPRTEKSGVIDEKSATGLNGDGQGRHDAPGEAATPSLLVEEGELVNASGHRDQLSRQYGLLSVCGMAMTCDNAWVAMGTSMSVAIASGGPPAVLYGLLVSGFYYGFINASIAELASAIPSAGGVYHWASILPGPAAGRMLGFFAGLVNFVGWIFGLGSITYVMAELTVQMYGVFHPDFEILQWHVFVTLALICVVFFAATVFGNRFLPALQTVGLAILIVGGIVTVIVLAAMPEQHATARDVFVWREENNVTGWPSGVAFLVGVLNGAFTIGTTDSVTHMAEELPQPRRSLPVAIFAQLILGVAMSFVYGIALFFGVTDLNAVVTSNASFPLAEAYLQATARSAPATFGLLLIIFLCLVPCLISTSLTAGRAWWALARDNATPAAGLFSRVDERLSCPVPATALVWLLTAAFGAIALGSKAAFQSLTGSFIVLTSASYLMVIAPNVVCRRRHMPRTGTFYMPGWIGYTVNVLACVFIVFFDLMFCFPPVQPTEVNTLSWNAVILAGLFALVAVWWLIHGRRNYPGPRLANIYSYEGHVVNLNGLEGQAGADGETGEAREKGSL